MLKVGGKKVGIWDLFKNPVTDALKMPRSTGGVYEMLKMAVKINGAKVKVAEVAKKVEEGLHVANLTTVDLARLKKLTRG